MKRIALTLLLCLLCLTMVIACESTHDSGTTSTEQEMTEADQTESFSSESTDASNPENSAISKYESYDLMVSNQTLTVLINREALEAGKSDEPTVQIMDGTKEIWKDAFYPDQNHVGGIVFIRNENDEFAALARWEIYLRENDLYEEDTFVVKYTLYSRDENGMYVDAEKYLVDQGYTSSSVENMCFTKVFQGQRRFKFELIALLSDLGDRVSGSHVVLDIAKDQVTYSTAEKQRIWLSHYITLPFESSEETFEIPDFYHPGGYVGE